jgi:DNA-binding IclR family transcriptional regulator
VQPHSSGTARFDRPKSRPHRSVERVATIIDAVGAHGSPARLTDVANEAGLDTGTTHRILTALVERGYIHRDDASRRYSIGFEIFRLGASDPARAITAQRAHTYLARLAGASNATVLIGGREGTKVHIYRRIDGDDRSRTPLPGKPGTYLDAHVTAIGKVLMAYAAESEISSLYAENPLQRYTANSITTVSRLLVELRQVRARRYSIEAGEWRAGVDGFAVPIFNPDGHVNLAIWVLAAPGAGLMRDAERSVELATRAAHDIILYATGKPPLIWPHEATGKHSTPKDTSRC